VDCYKTYQAVRGFSTGVYTKDEFKSKLQNINLSNLENYRQHIKSLIKDALKEEKVVEDKPIIEAVVEPVIESVVEADVIEEEIVVEKPVYSRKRSTKVEAE
jgi:hypothetical protein